MQFSIHIDESYVIPAERLGSLSLIDARVAGAREEDRGSLRTALSYLYLDAGPINLPKDRFERAVPYLEPRELLIARWLRTRTNGPHRKLYGTKSVIVARKSKYRCEDCGFPDVRALHWTGKKRIKIETEPNHAMEPTPVNVTIPADAGLAPFTSAAHLGR